MATRRPHRGHGRVEGGATAAVSKTLTREEEWHTGVCHHSFYEAGKVRRAMSDEAMRREHIRKAASPPE